MSRSGFSFVAVLARDDSGTGLLAILHLQRFHFSQSAHMALGMSKLGFQIIPQQIFGELHANYARPEDDDIHIVVLDALMGGIAIVRETGANSGKLICRDRSAHAAATN